MGPDRTLENGNAQSSRKNPAASLKSAKITLETRKPVATPSPHPPIAALRAKFDGSPFLHESGINPPHKWVPLSPHKWGP